jgi:mannose-6-phosphate isomerase-like protein (cupin superfamily)
VSGERFTFLRTAEDSRGELLQFELRIPARWRSPVVHVHTRQQERFELVSGAVRVRVGKTWRELSAGESIVAPPFMAHDLRNENDSEARLMVEFRPAMNTEAVLETVCALARDGKVGKRGVPNALALAVITRGLGDETYLAGMPVGLQRATLPLLAALGRVLGYPAEHR